MRPDIPQPEHAFDACPYSRTNNPLLVAVEMTLASVCELLENIGHKDAAFALAKAGSFPTWATAIADQSRVWARRGGMGAYRIHRREMIRALDAQDAEDAQDEEPEEEDAWGMA